MTVGNMMLHTRPVPQVVSVSESHPPDPGGAMRTARALLKPDTPSVFVMVDIRAGTGLRSNLGHEMGAFLYCVSLMHCMPQGLA